jgi:hypothetical protein
VKRSQDSIQAELDSKITIIDALQKRQKASIAYNTRLVDELEKSKIEIAKLRGQLMDLKAQRTKSDSTSEIVEIDEEQSAEDGLSETTIESPKPADIIEWVIKKKSK